MKLLESQRADGTLARGSMMNDTGSDVMTLFSADFPLLGNQSQFTGRGQFILIGLADGTSQNLEAIDVYIRLCRDDGTPWSNWILEQACVRPGTAAMKRLSGRGIRQAVYCGTDPFHDHLHMAATKGGLYALLRR
jgi:hypothetical protein